MDLSTSIDAAYQQAEDTENIAIQIEARIIAAGGKPLLRQYGNPVDADAIKQNLTLVSQLNRRDPKLATFLGVQSGYQQQLELEQAHAAAASERMATATAELQQKNQQAAAIRQQAALHGFSLTTGRRYGI